MTPGVCSAAATEAATCTCFLQSTAVILNEFPALSASSKSWKQWLHWENQLLEPTGCSCCCPLSEGTSLSYNRLQDLSLSLPLGTPAFGNIFPIRGTKLLQGGLCQSLLSAMFPIPLAEDAPLCSQAGRGTEHGEAEASGGSVHPETQPQGAGSAQPTRYVSWLVEPSPKQNPYISLAELPDLAEAEQPPEQAEIPAGWCEDDSCFTENSIRWDNLIPRAASLRRFT